MLPFSKLKADADSLIEVLGLNFDPDMALGNKVESPSLGTAVSTPTTPSTAASVFDDDMEVPPGQPVMPEEDKDSGNWDVAAGALGGAAAVAGGVALASALGEDSDDQGDLDLEPDAVDEMDLEMESTPEVVDDLDIDLDSESEADEDLDIDLGSESESMDELDLGMESAADAVDDLEGFNDIGEDSDTGLDDLDLGGMEEETSDEYDFGEGDSDFVAEDIPDPFEQTSNDLDESGLDELGGDLELSELGDDNPFDDFSSDDLGDLDLELEGEDIDLDEADLDSLAGDKKSSDDDLEGLLG
jgi:hypothetical protein